MSHLPGTAHTSKISKDIIYYGVWQIVAFHQNV